MVEFEEYEELDNLIDQNDGVATTDMRCLRDAHGVGRLGKHVRKNISDKLSSKGLGHSPKELPSSQYDKVLIYRLGEPAGELIEAVMDPGEDGDEVIRRQVNRNDQETLDRIRELVCD